MQPQTPTPEFKEPTTQSPVPALPPNPTPTPDNLPPQVSFPTEPSQPKGSKKILLIVSVILLVVVAAGLVYWFVLREKPTTNTANNDTPAVITPEPTADEPAGAKQTVIVMPKLGISFEVPGSLKTLEFEETKSDPPAYPIAKLILPDFEAPDCQEEGKSGPQVGIVWRVPGQYTENPSAVTGGQPVKQFSDFYIVYRAPGMDCSSDPAVQAELEQIYDDIETALKSLSRIE